MIYVDEIRTYGIYDRQGHARNILSCHMVTDGSIEELHQFAAKIGLKRSWFQGMPKHRHEHYDLTPHKRAKAIAAGAQSISLKEFGQMMAKKDGLL
jgi:hypothetical protein